MKIPSLLEWLSFSDASVDYLGKISLTAPPQRTDCCDRDERWRFSNILFTWKYVTIMSTNNAGLSPITTGWLNASHKHDADTQTALALLDLKAQYVRINIS